MTGQYLIGARLLLASLAVSIVPTSNLAAKEQATRGIEGSWRGDFGAGLWTFTFVRASGEWSGSYTHPKHSGRNTIRNLTVSQGAVKFSIKADTSVDFNLKLDRSKDAMSGTVRFGKGVTAGSPPVVVPVAVTRVS